jgi:hypothetical protein
MNKAILISLAAVVVTIVIIAWAALRFLRADDADPFDEIPDEPRRPSRAQEDARLREAVPAAASARRSPGPPAPADEMARPGGRGDRRPDRERLDPRADRPRPERDRGRDSGFRERGTQDRPVAADLRPANPGSAANPGSPAHPVPVAARAAKSPRPAGNGGDGPDWDTMSDVDYWAELAADKPFSSGETTIPPVGANGGRRAAEPAKARSASRPDQGALPSRQRQPRPAAATAGRSAEFSAAPVDPRPAHAPGRYANGAAEPATQSLAALARLGNQAPAQPPASPPRHSQPHPVPPRGAQPRDLPRSSQPAPQPRDLTSRPQRAVPAPLDDDPLTSPSFPAINTSDSRSYRTSRSDTQPGASRSAAAYSEPAQPFSPYPEAQRGNSAPSGYPVQSAPAGNPYGSFVTQPAASYQPPAAPVPQDSDYAAYTSQELPGGEGWYPPVNAHGNGTGQHRAPSPAPGGYLPGANGTNGYDPASYRPSQPETAAYHQPAYPAAQYDQGGYAVQDAMYGRDSYQGYPGYGTGGR